MNRNKYTMAVRLTGIAAVTLVLGSCAQLDPMLSRDEPAESHGAVEDHYDWPTKRVYISSRYGWRWGKMHKGLDLVARPGAPILASAPGRVVFAGWEHKGYGNMIIIDHGDDVKTVYAHNKVNLVRRGQWVERGQIIARLGKTGLASGHHLHFEYRVKGRAVNPEPHLALLCNPPEGSGLQSCEPEEKSSDVALK